MQASHSKATEDLALIFFKVRSARTQGERKSWQRRARIALAKLSHLTDQERHEVASVWAQPNVSRIDSPALRKLHHRTHANESETAKARQFTRAAFTLTGRKKTGLKPVSVAANDSLFCNQAVTPPKAQTRATVWLVPALSR